MGSDESWSEAAVCLGSVRKGGCQKSSEAAGREATARRLAAGNGAGRAKAEQRCGEGANTRDEGAIWGQVREWRERGQGERAGQKRGESKEGEGQEVGRGRGTKELQVR
eukprot:572027-Pleurochrysis_carterae.AAC.1